MANANHISNYYESEYEARRQKELAEAIACEKWQIQRAKELAAQMAEECPWVWRFGDGDGGSIINSVFDAFEEAGLRTSPAGYNPPTGEKEVDGEHTVYRFYDSNGTLLYVGVSRTPLKRWEQHQNTKEWFPDVAVITRSIYPDKASAYEAERRAIIDEVPEYNIVHNGGFQ